MNQEATWLLVIMADISVIEQDTIESVLDSCSQRIMSCDEPVSSEIACDGANSNCSDTNGDVGQNTCSNLPNNNVCTNISLSQCYDEEDCDSSKQSVDSSDSTPHLFSGEGSTGYDGQSSPSTGNYLK